MEPEAGEVVFFQGHPSWRSMLSFYLKGLLASLLAGVVVGVISRITDRQVQVLWVVLAVFVVFVLVTLVAQLRRIQTRYAITNQRLTIELGLLSRDLHQTRLERIQNVNARQSVLDRMLGIGTVDFDTAGEAQFDFSFRGVSDPRQIVHTVDRALHELRGGPQHPAADV